MIASVPLGPDTSARRRRYRARLPLLALGVLALLGALWGGLLRLGWPLPVVSSVAAFHGPLMVSGFLATVIGLERAVALGQRWAYASPLAAGLGGLALIIGVPGRVGPLLLTAASLGLTVVFLAILRRQAAPFTVVMALGAVAWLIGQVLWLAGWPIHRVAPWWVGFLVLTIAGERLELSRLVRVSNLGRVTFLLAIALFLGGLTMTATAEEAGARLSGGGLVALALWLARYDVARRTVRQPGLPRFIALCLLGGYVWLGAAGLLAISAPGATAGPQYDALLHMLFLGFVFSMIFGHAPIIFPAVLGWRVTFRRSFYAHLGLLHVTLLLRVTGDLLDWPSARRWGGLLNVLALLLFFANTAYSVLRPVPTPRSALVARETGPTATSERG